MPKKIKPKMKVKRDSDLLAQIPAPVDLRLVSCYCKLGAMNPDELPGKARRLVDIALLTEKVISESQPRTVRAIMKMWFALSYTGEFDVADSTRQFPVEVCVEYGITYIGIDCKIDDETIKTHASMMLQPYLAEMTQSLLQRMGLPPIPMPNTINLPPLAKRPTPIPSS